MIMQVLHCPNRQGTDIIRQGKTHQGKQRYRCQETLCDGRTFLLDDSYAGHLPGVKQQMVDNENYQIRHLGTDGQRPYHEGQNKPSDPEFLFARLHKPLGLLYPLPKKSGDQ